MSAIKFVLRFMHGLRLKYLLALFSIALAAFFSFLTPLVMKLIVDSVIGGHPVNLPWGVGPFLIKINAVDYLVKHLWLAGLAIVFIGFCGHSLSYLRGKLSAQCAEEFAKRLRNTLYDHIQKLPFAWHSKVQTGDIIQRCTSDIDTVKRFIGSQLVQLGRGIIMAILVIPIMLSLNVKMTFVSTIVIPLIFIYAVIFFRQVRTRFTAADESEGFMTTVLEESLNGIRVVRAFARQDYEIKRFEDAADDYREKCRRLITVLAYYWASSDILCLLQISGVLIIGIHLTINGTISLGTLLAFSTYVGMLLWPIREMGRILTDMGRAQVSVGRLKEILETPQEKLDGYFDLPEDYRIRGKIDFLNVSFAYNEDTPILHNINLSIMPGETIAILGATGSGKSTLVNLIPRLFDYTSGKIRIDGVELRKFDRQQIRRQVGIVLQEPFLYSRSIAENIGIAVPSASRELIEQVSREAALHNSIMEFDQQYDTVIGEKGVTLSGGQRQRSAIARALITNPAILILDDSLSAVDSETEREIQQNLLLRKGKATTILITHRLTSVAIADRILVLEHGRVVQLGTHQELLNSDGPYQRIWNIQHRLESEAI